MDTQDPQVIKQLRRVAAILTSDNPLAIRYLIQWVDIIEELYLKKEDHGEKIIQLDQYKHQ